MYLPRRMSSRNVYSSFWSEMVRDSHRLLSHHLQEAGMAHEARENPGNHGGRWPERYQMALQRLSQVLDTV